MRNFGAMSPQASGGSTYQFASWSDGGAATHNISTPAANRTYSATYRVSSSGTGSGLSVTYFNNANLTGTTVTRTDPIVAFTWGAGSPAAAIAADTFSARWTGQVQAQFTQVYTFYTQSNDGVRLWVNGQLACEQLDRPRDYREQRHDLADRRSAVQHPDGVLRERGLRHRTALLE